MQNSNFIGLLIYTLKEILPQMRHNLEMKPLVPSFLYAYQRVIAVVDFYEETKGDDFIYPDR